MNTAAQFLSGLLTIVGVVGLLKTSLVSKFAASDGVDFVGVTVNPFTNLLHLVAGLVGIAAATRLDRALRYLGALGVGGIVFAVLEFILGDSGSDIFGRDTDLAVAQLILSLGALGIWLWARPTAQARASRADSH